MSILRYQFAIEFWNVALLFRVKLKFSITINLNYNEIYLGVANTLSIIIKWNQSFYLKKLIINSYWKRLIRVYNL